MPNKGRDGGTAPYSEQVHYSDHGHFERLRPLIREVVTSKHFFREATNFDTNLVLDSRHEHFTHLHKLEETIEGNHIFRALTGHTHIVYAVDKKHRLILLRAFKNFKHYEKFLEDKKLILRMIEGA